MFEISFHFGSIYSGNCKLYIGQIPSIFWWYDLVHFNNFVISTSWWHFFPPLAGYGAGRFLQFSYLSTHFVLSHSPRNIYLRGDMVSLPKIASNILFRFYLLELAKLHTQSMYVPWARQLDVTKLATTTPTPQRRPWWYPHLTKQVKTIHSPWLPRPLLRLLRPQ